MSIIITGFGGISEIGGSKILVEDGDSRIFLDFGMPFGRYGEYFDGVFTRERASRGLLDLLALGILPPLRGVLRNDLIPALDPSNLAVTTIPPIGRQRKGRTHAELAPQAVDAFWERWRRRFPAAYRDLRRDGRPGVDAVLLSHAHQDHIADAIYLDPDIPAASSRMTAFISRVLADAGIAGQGAPYNNRYALDGDGMLHVDRDQDEYVTRPWYFVDGDPGAEQTDDPLQSAAAFWGTSAGSKPLTARPSGPPPLPLRQWPVDHSLFGATGYALQTSAGWIGYSGDMRMHGKMGRNTHAFSAGLAALQPVALLCEGTRLDIRHSTTEAEVHDRCHEAVRAAAGEMVVADFAARNVERLETFADIASQTHRCLLVQPRDAYLLRVMHLAAPDSVADWMESPSIALYADPKSTRNKWEDRVRQRYAGRTANHLDVARSPGDYLLAFSLTDVADLLDIFALRGGALGGGLSGIYLFSNSAAYDDEQKVDLERLWTWTRYLGLRMVGLKAPYRNAGGALVVEGEPGYHSSGHAGQPELVQFVRTVAPRYLIPVHTEHAKLWRGLLEGSGITIIEPEMYKAITL